VNEKTPNKQNLYSENWISIIISCDLINGLFLYSSTGNADLLKQRLQSLKVSFFNSKEKKYLGFELSSQCVFDIWYCSKLYGYGDLFKPNKSFLKKIVDNIYSSISHKTPQQSAYDYVFLRSLEECSNEYFFPDSVFKQIKENASRDYLCYFYYLTHVIFYDLKFGLVKYDGSCKGALEELTVLLTDPIVSSKILNVGYCDILSEILIAFILCDSSNTSIFHKIEKIIESFSGNSNYHTRTVVKVYENLKNCERKRPK